VVLEPAGAAQVVSPATGVTGVAVAVSLQEVEVLVHTGTEMVKGPSVRVKVVAPVQVYSLPWWEMTVGPGTYVVMVETTELVQLSGVAELLVQSAQVPAAEVVVAALLEVVVVVALAELVVVAVQSAQVPAAEVVVALVVVVVVLVVVLVAEAVQSSQVPVLEETAAALAETARAATAAAVAVNFILIVGVVVSKVED